MCFAILRLGQNFTAKVTYGNQDEKAYFVLYTDYTHQ